MPQCKAEHEIAGHVWYCVLEAPHEGTHQDDQLREWWDQAENRQLRSEEGR